MKLTDGNYTREELKKIQNRGALIGFLSGLAIAIAIGKIIYDSKR